MIIFKTIASLWHHLDQLVAQHQTIGFAPTMGALHQGHLTLIAESRKHCDVSVVSIFVNPTQFNDPKDFQKYPVTLDNDCRLLEEQQTDILFLPSVNEIYPDGLSASKHYDLGELENLLEGSFRPGHFQGVCQVVERLLELVQPDQLFLGQKDYQQCMVLQRLVTLMKMPVQVNIVPTVREKSGLAMSSRNLRLSDEQREQATIIYKVLIYLKENFSFQNLEGLKDTATKMILDAGFSKVDYVSIADAETLAPLTENSRQSKAVALIAAFLGEVRLIDNMLLN